MQENVIPDEEWRPIPGFDNAYEASSLGHIRRAVAKRSHHAGHIKVPFLNSNRRLGIGLADNGKFRQVFVHRVVAAAFLGPPTMPKMEINHIDGNPLNNAVTNLEYVDRATNMRHAFQIGLIKYVREYTGRRGEIYVPSRLTPQDVRFIRSHPEMRTKDLMIQFGVGDSAISDIRLRKTWKDID